MYKKIEVESYVREGLESKELEVIQAEKFARIAAIRGKEGQKVITWSEDKDGNPIIEKEAVVTPDEDGNLPWIVTKVDENGNPIIDKNGNPNTWIISHKKFIQKYEKDFDMIYKPIGGIQKFVQLKEDVIIHQWGEDYKISAGGYINITNEEDMYGISRRDFEDTYRIIKTKEKKLIKK